MIVPLPPAMSATTFPMPTPPFQHHELPQPAEGAAAVAPVARTLFVAQTINEWASPQGFECNGLLLKRPFNGKWDIYQADIDEAATRWGQEQALITQVTNGGTKRQLCARMRRRLRTTTPSFARTQLIPRFVSAGLRNRVSALLAQAALPAQLCDQLLDDACTMGSVVGDMCPAARTLEVKLEIFGENTCSRWHKDNFVGRALISYVSASGLEPAVPGHRCTLRSIR